LAHALLYFLVVNKKPDGLDNETWTELVMPKTMDSKKFWAQINLMDAFLYLLAGSAMLIISISFLLWLRF
jgi:hypothetical protein